MNKIATYSKALPIVTGIVFIAVLLASFSADYSDYYAANVYVTAITASAGCFTGTCVWYMKKAQAENAYKLQVAVYKTQASLELKNLEAKLEMQQRFKVGKQEIDAIQMDSQLDEMAQEAFMDARSVISQAKSDANTETTM